MRVSLFAQLRQLAAAFLTGCAVGALWDAGACLLHRGKAWLRTVVAALFLLLMAAGLFVLAMGTGDEGVRIVFLTAVLMGHTVYRLTLHRLLWRMGKRLRRHTARNHSKKISVF